MFWGFAGSHCAEKKHDYCAITYMPGINTHTRKPRGNEELLYIVCRS